MKQKCKACKNKQDKMYCYCDNIEKVESCKHLLDKNQMYCVKCGVKVIRENVMLKECTCTVMNEDTIVEIGHFLDCPKSKDWKREEPPKTPDMPKECKNPMHKISRSAHTCGDCGEMFMPKLETPDVKEEKYCDRFSQHFSPGQTKCKHCGAVVCCGKNHRLYYDTKGNNICPNRTPKEKDQPCVDCLLWNVKNKTLGLGVPHIHKAQPGWEERFTILLQGISAEYDRWSYAKHLYFPIHDFIKDLLSSEQEKFLKEIEEKLNDNLGNFLSNTRIKSIISKLK